MKIKTLVSVSMLLFSVIVSAQIKVATNNNVGVGEEDPVSSFAIESPGYSFVTAYIESAAPMNYGRTFQAVNRGHYGSYGFSGFFHTVIDASSAVKNYGLRGSSYSSSLLTTKRSYGVYGLAGNCTSGWNYGIYGELYGTGDGAAVFGTIAGRGDTDVDGKYAGYFRGNVYIEDDLTVDGDFFNPSDMNLKKDVRLLKEGGISQIEKLKSLNSIMYKLKNPNELSIYGKSVSDTAINISDEILSADKYTRDKIGLSAQELQIVYPELVKERSNGFLSVNYIGLIPVLVEAIKEQDVSISKYESQLIVQSKELAKQADEIAELRKLVEGLLSTEKE